MRLHEKSATALIRPCKICLFFLNCVDKDSPQVLHGVLQYIRTNPGVVSEQLKSRFYSHIERSFASIPVLLRPLLPPRPRVDIFQPCNIKMDTFGSLPDILREAGYVATSTVADCTKVISKAGTINAPAVARSLFIMGKTMTGYETEPAVAATLLEREFTAQDHFPKVRHI